MKSFLLKKSHGNLERDFTYVDDVIACLMQLIDAPVKGEVPHEIYNIGNSSPVKLMDFIETIERTAGKKAIKEFVGMQPGDVLRTWFFVPYKAGFDYDIQSEQRHR